MLSSIISLQLLGCISAATAANAHFQKASAAIIGGGALQVQWTETGLGNNLNIDYSVEADATSTWACINKGGKNPQASNKQDFSQHLDETVTLSSGKNGRIDGVRTIGPVPPSSDFSCPPGQNTVLFAVSYSNVMVTDTTNGLSTTVAGTFNKNFP